MTKGRFITFEGGEGAGKSTQINAISEKLSKNGIAHNTTREPGGTDVAEKIRQFLLKGFGEAFGANGEAILFSAARLDHMEKKIKPNLGDGSWVLCDRFIDSTRAYQGFCGHVDIKLIDRLENIVIEDTKPDLTFILDLDATIGMERVRTRYHELGLKVEDRFEKEDIAWHQNLREAFLQISKQYPDRCVVIDAHQPAEIMTRDIWKVIEDRFL